MNDWFSNKTQGRVNPWWARSNFVLAETRKIAISKWLLDRNPLLLLPSDRSNISCGIDDWLVSNYRYSPKDESLKCIMTYDCSQNRYSPKEPEWLWLTHLVSHFNSRIIIQGARTILAVYFTTTACSVAWRKSIPAKTCHKINDCPRNNVSKRINPHDQTFCKIDMPLNWNRIWMMVTQQQVSYWWSELGFKRYPKLHGADKHESERRWLPWLGRNRAYFARDNPRRTAKIRNAPLNMRPKRLRYGRLQYCIANNEITYTSQDT